MQNSLKNRTALITGASRGIGKSIAKLFAENGCDVILAARNPDLLNALADELNKAGSNATAIPVDLEAENSILQMMEKSKMTSAVST